MKPSPLREAFRTSVRLPPPAVAARFQGRTARALVGLCAELQKRAGDGEPFTLRQTDLADALCVQQQAVSAAMKQLRAEGILRRNTGGGTRPSTFTFHGGDAAA